MSGLCGLGKFPRTSINQYGYREIEVNPFAFVLPAVLGWVIFKPNPATHRAFRVEVVSACPDKGSNEAKTVASITAVALVTEVLEPPQPLEHSMARYGKLVRGHLNL